VPPPRPFRPLGLWYWPVDQGRARRVVDGAAQLGITGIHSTGYPYINWGAGPAFNIANVGYPVNDVIHNVMLAGRNLASGSASPSMRRAQELTWLIFSTPPIAAEQSQSTSMERTKQDHCKSRLHMILRTPWLGVSDIIGTWLRSFLSSPLAKDGMFSPSAS